MFAYKGEHPFLFAKNTIKSRIVCKFHTEKEQKTAQKSSGVYRWGKYKAAYAINRIGSLLVKLEFTNLMKCLTNLK